MWTVEYMMRNGAGAKEPFRHLSAGPYHEHDAALGKAQRAKMDGAQSIRIVNAAPRFVKCGQCGTDIIRHPDEAATVVRYCSHRCTDIAEMFARDRA